MVHGYLSYNTKDDRATSCRKPGAKNPFKPSQSCSGRPLSVPNSETSLHGQHHAHLALLGLSAPTNVDRHTKIVRKIGHRSHAGKAARRIASLDIERVHPLWKFVFHHHFGILRRAADDFVTPEVLALAGLAAVDLIFAARTDE